MTDRRAGFEADVAAAVADARPDATEVGFRWRDAERYVEVYAGLAGAVDVGPVRAGYELLVAAPADAVAALVAAHLTRGLDRVRGRRSV